jgi:hypothetical protein
MGNLTMKDRREIIKETVKSVLMGGSVPRLAVHLWNGRDCKIAIDRFQFPVFMKARNLLGLESDGFDALKALKVVREQIANLFHDPRFQTEENGFPSNLGIRRRCTVSSPIVLEGIWEPMITRRCDQQLPSHTVEAMQHQSNMPLVIDEACYEAFTDYHKHLLKEGLGSNDDPVDVFDGTVSPESDGDKFLRRHEQQEFEAIGSDEFYIPFSIGDASARMYANSGGFGPTYSKLGRACIRGAEGMPINDEGMENWSKWLDREFHLNDRNPEDWVSDVLKDPLQYLIETGDKAAVGAAFGWHHATKTGECNYLMETDAPASGYGHILATLGIRGDNLLRFIDMNHTQYQHPHAVLAHQMKRMDAHSLRLAPLSDIIKQLAKPTFNPGQYGGGEAAIASMIMGLDYIDGEDGKYWNLGDEEHPKLPFVPPLLRSRFAGVSNPQLICNEMMLLCRTYSQSLKRSFPELQKLNKLAQERWVVSMESIGIPNAFDLHGYHNQPHPFYRHRRGVTERVKCHYYDKDFGRRTSNFSALRCTLASAGTAALAMEIHMKDACTIAVTLCNLREQGVNALAIHDALLINAMQTQYGLEGYQKGFEFTHNLKIGRRALMLR